MYLDFLDYNVINRSFVLVEGGAPSHTALVISPLRALMRDKVDFLEQHDVSSIALMDTTQVKGDFICIQLYLYIGMVKFDFNMEI